MCLYPIHHHYCYHHHIIIISITDLLSSAAVLLSLVLLIFSNNSNLMMSFIVYKYLLCDLFLFIVSIYVYYTLWCFFNNQGLLFVFIYIIGCLSFLCWWNIILLSRSHPCPKIVKIIMWVTEYIINFLLSSIGCICPSWVYCYLLLLFLLSAFEFER